MSWAIKEGLGVQCAKALGRASVGECVTGISWGDEIERRGTWGHCTNNVLRGGDVAKQMS